MKKNSVYIRSISCKGVKSPIPFQKPSIYARVSLSGTSQRLKTPPDAKNGENPEWDCQMNFDLENQDSLLQIDLTDQSTLLPNVLVGTVHVPVSDLVGGGSGGRVSYQVKNSEGKANGTIHIWYKSDGTELNHESETEAQFSPQPSAPPLTNFSYQQPPLEPYPAYSSSPIPNNLFPSSYTSSPNPTNSIYPPPSNPINSIYPPPPSNNGIYPPVPAPGFGSGSPYYPQPATQYPPVESQSTYYPQVDRVGESIYYPPPETRSCDCRELSDLGFAYGASNGFYPPPPTRYQYS
ncbi:hypothetical protein LUZ60_007865 [Juncus effusus]|nr:hypothetical protein LUZ60_007865 [Juncus effusus]